jgi:hypothetical protein
MLESMLRIARCKGNTRTNHKSDFFYFDLVALTPATARYTAQQPAKGYAEYGALLTTIEVAYTPKFKCTKSENAGYSDA